MEALPMFGTIDTVTAPINNLYNLMLAIVIAVGAIVLLWGIFEIAMAFYNHDSAAKVQAVPKLVAGIIMVLAGTVVTIIKG